MTLADLLSQLHRILLTQGGQVPLAVVDPETQERSDVTVETRIGPGGTVYVALVPVTPVAR